MARASLILWLLLLFVATVTAERENKSSSGGLFWSTAKEEGDLVRKPDANVDSTAQVVDDRDGIDGGFSSLDGMLQWAIGKQLSDQFNRNIIVYLWIKEMKFVDRPLTAVPDS